MCIGVWVCCVWGWCKGQGRGDLAMEGEVCGPGCCESVLLQSVFVRC
jgi:hypothetical protein